MNPTLSAGGLPATMAMSQSMPFGSMHMGSSPGVPGSSGVQVQPLVPFFKVRILPLLMSTTEASLEMAAGAADMALSMRAWSDLGAAGAAAKVAGTANRRESNVR